MQTNIQFGSYFAQSLLESERFPKKKPVEKIKKNFMFNTFFFENLAVYENHTSYRRTHTNTEYVILLASSQQQRLCKSTLMLRLYVLCRFHPFGTACCHVIVLLVVLSTLPPLPSTLVEPSLWPACPATSDSGGIYLNSRLAPCFQTPFWLTHRETWQSPCISVRGLVKWRCLCFCKFLLV
jgi:hypothetical protein